MNIEYHNKKLIVEHLPEWIKILKNNYRFYFITFTFNDQFYKVHKSIYKKYFSIFYQKLNKCTLGNRNQHYKKSIMILFPETSYKETKNNMVVPDHYHGFIGIHNDAYCKLYKNVQLKPDTNCENRKGYLLEGDLKQSFQKEIFIKKVDPFHDTDPYLETDSILLQPINNEYDITEYSGYMTKNWRKPDIDDNRNYDDWLLYGRKGDQLQVV